MEPRVRSLRTAAMSSDVQWQGGECGAYLAPEGIRRGYGTFGRPRSYAEGSRQRLRQMAFRGCLCQPRPKTPQDQKSSWISYWPMCERRAKCNNPPGNCSEVPPHTKATALKASSTVKTGLGAQPFCGFACETGSRPLARGALGKGFQEESSVLLADNSTIQDRHHTTI